MALILGLAGAVLLGLYHGPFAQPHKPGTKEFPELHDAFPDEFSDEFQTPGFRVIPLHEAAKIASGRFRGRLIAARLKPPRPDERARGVELVHELRLLTQARNVLLIRLDARSGAFLEVAGTGLTEARRQNEDRE